MSGKDSICCLFE